MRNPTITCYDHLAAPGVYYRDAMAYLDLFTATNLDLIEAARVAEHGFRALGTGLQDLAPQIRAFNRQRRRKLRKLRRMRLRHGG